MSLLVKPKTDETGSFLENISLMNRTDYDCNDGCNNPSGEMHILESEGIRLDCCMGN